MANNVYIQSLIRLISIGSISYGLLLLSDSYKEKNKNNRPYERLEEQPNKQSFMIQLKTAAIEETYKKNKDK